MAKEQVNPTVYRHYCEKALPPVPTWRNLHHKPSRVPISQTLNLSGAVKCPQTRDLTPEDPFSESLNINLQICVGGKIGGREPDPNTDITLSRL